MNILTPSIVGCALLLTAGCIVIAPNHGGKRQTESEEVVEMDTSTVKRTIIIELSLIHISEPTRRYAMLSRMPSSA